MEHLAFHQDLDERNNFHFPAGPVSPASNTKPTSGGTKRGNLFSISGLASRTSPAPIHYQASKKKAEADVVNVVRNKLDAASRRVCEAPRVWSRGSNSSTTPSGSW